MTEVFVCGVVDVFRPMCLCDFDEDHDGPHVCACGNTWTEDEGE